MPRYIGSNRNPIAPKFRTTDYPGITNEDAYAWWNSVAEGISFDADVGTKLDNGKSLYYCNDEAELVPAVKEGEDLSDPNVIRNLMRMSMDGRLFTRDFGTITPRQVATEAGQPFDVGVAAGHTATLPEPAAPKAPFFLKILAYPFSKSIRKEYQEYWKATNWRNMIRDSKHGTRVITDDFTKEKEEADFLEREAEQEEKLFDKQFEKDYHVANPLEIEGYFLDRANVSKRSAKELVESLREPDMTLEKFYENLPEEVLGWVASAITNKSTELFTAGKEEEWAKYLKEQQYVFRSIEKGLKDHLPSLFEQDEAMQENLQLAINDLADQDTLKELQNQVQNLIITGVASYRQKVEREVALTKEIFPSQNQPQQVQQDAAQLQAQPQPEPLKPPIVSGP